MNNAPANCLILFCQVPTVCQLFLTKSSVFAGVLFDLQLAIAKCFCQLANCIKHNPCKALPQLASWQVPPYSYGVMLALPPGSAQQHPCPTPKEPGA
jgi:hypothetical protein